MENLNIRKKQISLLTNSTHYLLDNKKELEDLNNFKSNSFYLNSNHQYNQYNKNNQSNQKIEIESYIDSLVKNKMSEQNNEQISNLINNEENINSNENENNSINNSNENYNDNDDKYNSLIIKNKELIEENKNLNNIIKNNEMVIEEQNSVILLLKTNIENDFFKNNDIKKYITIENIVDFIKLKNENEQYKKELVLSQALVNSLQSENQQLIKEKEKLNIKKEENKKDIEIESEYSQNTESINIDTEDFLSNSGNKIDMNIKESDLVNELIEENKQLKKLIQEATVKLNYLLVNEKNNKLISDNNNILNIQLNEKINIIKVYEEKFDFFNSYISEMKSSFINMQNKLLNYINSYNKMANDDLNSLLSNSFSNKIMKINMNIENLMQIEQYNLESKPELDIHEIILKFLSAINDEFLILYEKVFQTNNYFRESNNKISELEKEINENKKKFINNKNEFNYVDKLINDGGEYKNEYIKTINKLNLELSLKENEKYYLTELTNNFKKDLEEVINILLIFMKIFSEKKVKNNEINISIYLKNYIENLKNKIKLMIEKEKTMEQMNKNNNKIKNLKLENKLNNFSNLNFYKDEYINNIVIDFDKKIKEKENLLLMNKENINLLIMKS